MSDIFISYAREDWDKAKALAELCQQQDWSVWWDRRIPPGRSFDEVIEEALGAAKCVVVLWSKSSASSDWVKGEAAEGLRRKILVPVRIDSANVPLEFRRLQTVDLSDWKGEAGHLELGGFLEAVAANIKGVVQRPPSEGSQRKLMKPVLTVLAIVALVAAGFAFYKFAEDRARLGSRASAGGSPAPQPPQTLTPTPVATKSSPIATLELSPTIQKVDVLPVVALIWSAVATFSMLIVFSGPLCEQSTPARTRLFASDQLISYQMLPRPLVANENCSTSTVFLYKPIKMLRIEKDLLRGAVDLMASSS
jgi:TIR domain